MTHAILEMQDHDDHGFFDKEGRTYLSSEIFKFFQKLFFSANFWLGFELVSANILLWRNDKIGK